MLQSGRVRGSISELDTDCILLPQVPVGSVSASTVAPEWGTQPLPLCVGHSLQELLFGVAGPHLNKTC